ncbi:unnamed protein product [Arctia plantaginis]|uniref:Uncharacterized protein n=1 Tax=Arctia plantaginis TaxID=874455 RepID=A0A8S0Z3X8_ARCPL|nr:unnamed protein product [Arctia plantaginis]
MPGNSRTRSIVIQPNTMARNCGWILMTPKKRILACLLSLLVVVFTIIIITTATWQKSSSDQTKIQQPAHNEPQLMREKNMEESIASIKSKLDFLESQYRGRQEDLLNLHSKIATGRGANLTVSQHNSVHGASSTTFAPEVVALLKNMSGFTDNRNVDPMDV